MPFVVFLAVGLLEPTRSGDGLAGALGIPFAAYPFLYSLRIVATLLALARSWTPLRRWLGRPTWWPPLVGLTLVVPWIVLASLQREAGWFSAFGSRAAFNPFADCGDGVASRAFVATRVIGLVAVVPLIEELFLRGFLMRYVINEDFWTVPFGMLTVPAIGACLFYAAASHPSECVAAAGWFAVATGIAAATAKVRAWPTWRRPVGVGASRPRRPGKRIGLSAAGRGITSATTRRWRSPRPRGRDSCRRGRGCSRSAGGSRQRCR